MIRTSGPKRHKGVHVGVGSIEIADRRLGLGSIFTFDAQNLGREAFLFKGSDETAAASVQAGMAYLVINAGAVLGAAINHLQTAIIPLHIILCAPEGQIRNSIFFRPWPVS